MKRAISLLVLAFVLFGCGRTKDKQVEGQIFIVLQNRETIKLSLVQVDVITEAEARARITSTCLLATNKLAQLKADMISSEKQLADSSAKVSGYSYSSHESSGAKGSTYSMERCVSPERCWDLPWTNVIYTIISDANGTFTLPLSLNRKHLYISARASRKTLTGDEFYGWIIPLEGQRVILGNNNMSGQLADYRTPLYEAESEINIYRRQRAEKLAEETRKRKEEEQESARKIAEQEQKAREEAAWLERQRQIEAQIKAQKRQEAEHNTRLFGFLTENARAGSGYSQMRIAKIYLTGQEGIAQDLEKAKFWARCAVTNEEPEAAKFLSEIRTNLAGLILSNSQPNQLPSK